MKTEKTRLAIVGYGRRGRSLFSLACRSFPEVEPVGACDASSAALTKATEDFPGISTHHDFGEMLDSCRPDAVIVSTPGNFHADLCIQALGKDIHVLSEIPSVDSYEEAVRLWDAHLTSKALYMAGANPNVWGFVEEAVALRKQGLFGEPFYLEAEYVHDIRNLLISTPWRATFASIKYCTHSLGPLLRLIDEDLDTVSSLGTAGQALKSPDREDAMVAIFRTKSDVVVRVLTSFVNNCPFEGHRYRIYTSKGYFERTPVFTPEAADFKTFFFSKELHSEKKMHELPVGFARPGSEGKDGHGGADFAILEGFLTAIRTGQPSPISLREGLRMTLPGVFAAESATKNGVPVTIKYPWRLERVSSE